MRPVVLGRDYRCMRNEWFHPNASAFAFNLAAAERGRRHHRGAIAFHIDGLRESGQPVPEPSRVTATYVDVAA